MKLSEVVLPVPDRSRTGGKGILGGGHVLKYIPRQDRSIPANHPQDRLLHFITWNIPRLRTRRFGDLTAPSSTPVVNLTERGRRG